jgi:hypothetical protein
MNPVPWEMSLPDSQFVVAEKKNLNSLVKRKKNKECDFKTNYPKSQNLTSKFPSYIFCCGT